MDKNTIRRSPMRSDEPMYAQRQVSLRHSFPIRQCHHPTLHSLAHRGVTQRLPVSGRSLLYSRGAAHTRELLLHPPHLGGGHVGIPGQRAARAGEAPEASRIGVDVAGRTVSIYSVLTLTSETSLCVARWPHSRVKRACRPALWVISCTMALRHSSRLRNALTPMSRLHIAAAVPASSSVILSSPTGPNSWPAASLSDVVSTCASCGRKYQWKTSPSTDRAHFSPLQKAESTVSQINGAGKSGGCLLSRS
mmetsp:Transcript_17520/g.49724  ORF Transcript_17520/g.49724 Transcript_17520/m.49724 type:complete len:250 (-) Transcript_17520:1522-2271(-)